MTMGNRITIRQQLLGEQADAAGDNLGDKRPDDREHPDQPTAALMGADSAL
ncbi:MAG: hypothetical protein M3332_17680 [Actinomycetota bacterium]|nr:hypothetical protein [Actinomycetota bacterium]